jgi:hypothetical protein
LFKAVLCGTARLWAQPAQLANSYDIARNSPHECADFPRPAMALFEGVAPGDMLENAQEFRFGLLEKVLQVP